MEKSIRSSIRRQNVIKDSVTAQHQYARGVSQLIQTRKEKINEIVRVNQNEQVGLEYFVNQSRMRLQRVRNGGSKIERILKDHPSTQEFENNGEPDHQSSIISTQRSIKDERVGGALKILEKVFNYPQEDLDRCISCIEAPPERGIPIVEKQKSQPSLNTDFIKKQQALMNNEMLQEYQANSRFDPIKEIWKEKNINQFFQEKNQAVEKYLATLERNQETIKNKKVKLKLGQIGGKQDPFEEDFEERMKYALEPSKPIFSRHKSVKDNLKIGSFKPKPRKQFGGKTLKAPGEDDPKPTYSLFEDISFGEILAKIDKVKKIGNNIEDKNRIKTKHELILDQITDELRVKVEGDIKKEQEWDREYKLIKQKKEKAALSRLKNLPMKTIQIHDNYEFNAHNKYDQGMSSLQQKNVVHMQRLGALDKKRHLSKTQICQRSTLTLKELRLEKSKLYAQESNIKRNPFEIKIN